MARYVQAWRVTFTDRPVMLVYTQSIALDFWSQPNGLKMEALTIVRHDDGSREYLEGCLASAVAAYRGSE